MRVTALTIRIVFVLVWCAMMPLAAGAKDSPGLVITSDMQFSYAQTLYQNQDYTAARVELKRFLYFFPQDERTHEAAFKIAMSLYHSKQYQDAAQGFNRLIRKGKKDPYTRESYFMQSRSFWAMGNIGYAQVVLQNYLKLTEDQNTKDRIYMELARIHIQATRDLGRDSLDQAEKYLTLISPLGREDNTIKETISAIEQVKVAPRKNPILSGILAIIPGGGFLYCQRYKDAFVTFCLNAGLIYGAYTAFDHDNPALGGVIAFVETGFYAGNIYGSVSAAHKYNKALQIKILGREFNLNAGVDPTTHSYLFSLKHPF
jgi:outer membrane protein assembly factor BamD (BamD/ComL family)